MVYRDDVTTTTTTSYDDVCVAGALLKQCDAQYGGDYYNYNEPVDYAYPDLSPKVGNQKNVGVYLLAPCFSIISSGAWLRLW